MHELLLAINGAGFSVGAALPEALRVSGIALPIIFMVMGFFGAMITLLSVLFPESDTSG